MGLKSKLAMAVATSAAGAAMIAGGSFALFTSSATNASNTFSAGTVKIAVNGESGFSGTINNLAPGDSGSDTFTLDNSGSSLDVSYTVKANVQSGAGTLVQGDATKDLAVTVQRSLDNGVTWQNTDDAAATSYFMPANGKVLYKVSYSLPKAADTPYQGASSTVQVQFDATQNRNGAGLTSSNE